MKQELEKTKKTSNVPPMYVYALGGLGEVGKNMYVVEQGNEIWIMDAGIKFAKEISVDGIIPSFNHLVKHQNKIRGLIVTHGHEDHIGAIPHLLNAIKIPKVYAGRIATKLINRKLAEKGVARQKIEIINNKSTIKTLNFFISFFNVNHSIPDCYGIVFKSKHGTVINTADFKFDLTPVGTRADLHKMANLGQEGVTLMLSDSTNALTDTFSLSESTVKENLNNLIKNAKGRIIIATFASNVYRVREIINLALKHNRKIGIFGYSMEKVIRIAKNIKYINANDEMFIEQKKIKDYKNEEILMVSTGTQGEPLSALSKMADGIDQNIKLHKGDTVIFASSAIPGNYEPVEKIINKLVKLKVSVITNQTNPGVHASGHGGKQEQLLMFNLLKPQFFMPVHGETVMLVKHGKIAMETGIPKKNIFIKANGGRIMVQNGIVTDAGYVYARDIYVDETSLTGQSQKVISDRNQMSKNGVVIVAVGIDSKKNQIIISPEVESKGTTTVKKHGELFNKISHSVETNLENYYNSDEKISFAKIKEIIINTTEEEIFKTKKIKPIVVPIVLNYNIGEN